MNKLKTALYGAAMAACIATAATSANAQPVGTLKMVGPAQATTTVHFDVMLPLRNKSGLEALAQAQTNPKSPQYHKWLTPAQFGAQFGPSAAAIKSVASYLSSRGFTVKTYLRSVRVTGTTAQVAQNFGVKLVSAKSEDGTSHIVTNDRFTMPSALSSVGAQIFSFAPHVAHTYSMKVSDKPLNVGSTRTASNPGQKNIQGYASNSAGSSVNNRYSDTGPYWFDDLKQANFYPSATATVNIGGNNYPINGTGTVIAALMSSDVLDSDIKALFDHENWSTITGTPDPTLAGRFYVDGGAPFGNYASLEASLDTQQELTGATGAAVVLVDIPDLSDGNILAGYLDIDEYDFASVVSSSFGECELFYFPVYNGGVDYRDVLAAEHELFLQGNVEGITFLVSSGDEAGHECPTPSYFYGGPAHYVASVSTPASDPNVTAVGGTNVVTNYVSGSLDSQYAGQNAWDDPEFPNDPYGVGVNVTGAVWGAGGGYSQVYAAPSYQSLVPTGSTTARAVPDVGMQVGGCPYGASDYNPHQNVCNGGHNPLNGMGNTQRSSVVVAYGVGVGGGFYAVIGTSVSSPEFAGVVSALVEQNGRMGNLNPFLYSLAAAGTTANHAFQRNIQGFNDVESTDLNTYYSLSVGVGTPIVTRFLGDTGVHVAGTPQTLSNP